MVTLSVPKIEMCPDGWTQRGTSCLQFNTEAKTRENSAVDCASRWTYGGCQITLTFLLLMDYLVKMK